MGLNIDFIGLDSGLGGAKEQRQFVTWLTMSREAPEQNRDASLIFCCLFRIQPMQSWNKQLAFAH